MSDPAANTTDIRLSAYLDGMRAAATSDELEAAIQAPFNHSYRGKIWAQISAVRVASGLEICDAHPLGHLVPRLGKRHVLTVAGETYRVGYGGNSTGVRYCWHAAEQWTRDILCKRGLSRRASNLVWDRFGSYPHRCLKTLEMAMAGEIPDPVLDVMIRHERTGYGNPVKITVAQNNADTFCPRATRHCPCGGTLFDWGSGWDGSFSFINWHCNECPDVFTEYLSKGRLARIRQEGRSVQNVEAA